MLKAVTIEVMELSDAKGAIGTFKVVDTWNGFKKLQEIHTGDIMMIAPVQTATMTNTFAGLFADIFSVELAKDVTVISASPDLALRITEGRQKDRDIVVSALESKMNKMRDAMGTFCRRVEAGEVRSDRTYNQFMAEIGKLDGPKSMNRNRPYDGQAHTDLGVRGRQPITGLTFRDLNDCFIRAVLLSACHLVPKLYDEACKGENAKLNGGDLYGFNLDELDPIAIGQNLSCEVERVMGIFPNIPGHRPEGE